MSTSAYHDVVRTTGAHEGNHRSTSEGVRARSVAATARWRDILRRWQRSGVSVRAFCEREKLCEGVFHHWKSKLIGRRQAEAGKFVPLSVCRVELGQAPLELVLANGRRLKIAADFDPQVLAKLIAVAEPTA